MHLGTIIILLFQWCYLTLAEPRLNFALTTDVNFVCGLEGFDRRINDLLALEISRRLGPEESGDVVLVSVDAFGTWKSSYLTSSNRPFKIASTFIKDRKFISSLEITILSVDSHDYGMYVCRIYYTDHPADAETSVWEGQLNLTKELIEVKQKCFQMKVTQGLVLTCDIGLSVAEVSLPNATQIFIHEELADIVYASWSTNDIKHYSRVVSAVFNSSHVLQAHVTPVTCTDEGSYRCVMVHKNSKVHSDSKNFQLSGCSSSKNVTNDENEHTFLSSSRNDNSEVSSFFSNSLLPALVSSVIGVAVTITVVYLLLGCLRKNQFLRDNIHNEILLAIIMQGKKAQKYETGQDKNVHCLQQESESLIPTSDLNLAARSFSSGNLHSEPDADERIVDGFSLGILQRSSTQSLFTSPVQVEDPEATSDLPT